MAQQFLSIFYSISSPVYIQETEKYAIVKSLRWNNVCLKVCPASTFVVVLET